MRKTIYFTPVVAALLGYSQALFQQAPTAKNGTLCSGTYYEGINSMYLDCYDQLGNLVSQDENHYEFSLENACTNMTYGDLSQNLTGWLVPNEVTTDTQLTCCDYFQRTVGYVFTQCDQGINVVVLPDKVSGEESMQYQTMTTEYKPLDWNWDDLMTLLNTYCSTSAGGATGGNGTTDANATDLNNTVPMEGMDNATIANDTNMVPPAENSTELKDNWQNLDFAWSDLLANATANMDMASWDKATYMYWIQTYDQIQLAFQQYLVSQGLLEAVDYVAIWQDAWNDEAVTLEDVLAQLNSSDQYALFQQWFQEAFGENGYVAAQTGTETQPTGTSTNAVPELLVAIVDWISGNVDQEVSMRCTACQFNQTPGTNETPEGNGTGAVVVLPPIAPENYTAPTDCQVSEDGMTITCQNAEQGNVVTIPFVEINDFRDHFSEEGFCTGILQAEQNCSMGTNESDTLPAEGETAEGQATGEAASGENQSLMCLQQGVFSAMSGAGNANIYGLLHFDSSQCVELRTACQQLVGEEEFTIAEEEFIQIFAYDFGDLSNGTGSTGNESTGNESTGNDTNIVLPTIDPTTYTEPDGCTLADDQASIYCGSSASGDAVNVIVADYNTWLTTDNVRTLCTDGVNSYDGCSQTSGATPECVSQNLYNVMGQLQGIAYVYGYLHFDDNSVEQLYPVCQSLLADTFTLDEQQWSDLFTYDFGDISQQ